MTNSETKNRINNIGWGKIVIIVLLPTFISSLMTLLLITTMTASRSQYKQDITQINNTLQHMVYAASGTDKYASYQNTVMEQMNEETQVDIEQLEGKLTDAINTKASTSDLNSLKSTVNTDLNTLKTSVDSKAASADLTDLKTTVDTKIQTLETAINTQSITISSGLIDASHGADRFLWIADDDYQVTKIYMLQINIEADDDVASLYIRKVGSSDSDIEDGNQINKTEVDLGSSIEANEVSTISLSTTASYLKLSAEDALALDFTGTVTGYKGCVTIVLKKI